MSPCTQSVENLTREKRVNQVNSEGFFFLLIRHCKTPRFFVIKVHAGEETSAFSAPPQKINCVIRLI